MYIKYHNYTKVDNETFLKSETRKLEDLNVCMYIHNRDQI